MIWMMAKGRALITKPPKLISNFCLCIIVTATSVDAEPIGVKFPPRLAPKITDHHNELSPAVFCALRIFANIAASGMLSVTELKKDALTNRADPPKLSPKPIIELKP